MKNDRLGVIRVGFKFSVFLALVLLLNSILFTALSNFIFQGGHYLGGLNELVSGIFSSGTDARHVALVLYALLMLTNVFSFLPIYFLAGFYGAREIVRKGIPLSPITRLQYCTILFPLLVFFIAIYNTVISLFPTAFIPPIYPFPAYANAIFLLPAYTQFNLVYLIQRFIGLLLIALLLVLFGTTYAANKQKGE